MAINEATERAQEATGKVTARDLLDTIRKHAKGCYQHGHALRDRPSYSDAFIFRASVEDEAGKVCTSIAVPGWVSNGYTSKREERAGASYGRYMSYTEAYRPTSGFWSLTYNEGLRNILELLPKNAEVAFHVYLDAGTNEYLVRADCYMVHELYEGLHADRLFLVAEYQMRGKTVRREYLISTTCGAHNTARFGAPVCETDTTGSRL